MSMSFLFDREVWLLAEYVKKIYWEQANRAIEREKEIDREGEGETFSFNERNRFLMPYNVSECSNKHV